MIADQRKILVTSALPYANGSLHLGHMLEAIQTDIWVRFQKQHGHVCYYVCADDAHGTAIMLKAQENSCTPEEQIAKIQQEHEKDYLGFNINFDHFHSTHSKENQELSALIYSRLKKNGHIEQREIKQLFDVSKGMFLADRFIKGQCPKCHAEEQYGDNCEVCGSTYNASELIAPYSTLSGDVPEIKSSEHFFFKLTEFQSFLKVWVNDEGRLQTPVANKLKEWLESGLQNWDISRDAPYFGFEIPDAPGKYFYVWLDAPVGYMASFKKMCELKNVDFDDFWSVDSDAELYHFIGKDIVNFHALFWPAMLSSAQYRTPTALFVHGFVTINGQKMSKSRGTFITASHYLEKFNADYLRYYFAYKLTSQVDDIDLNLEDFAQRVNSDLVGKVVNIPSRSIKFLMKFNDGMTSSHLLDESLWSDAEKLKDEALDAYEKRDFNKAMRAIMKIADATNEFFDSHKPWALAKDESTQDQVVLICSQCINHFALIMSLLKPVIPDTAVQSELFLNCELTFNQSPMFNHKLNEFKPLMKRLDKTDIMALIALNDSTSQVKEASTKNETQQENKGDMISFDDFSKIDLRVAKIIDIQDVKKAKKLVQLTLDVGELGVKKVLSGIKEYYENTDVLIGKNTVLVANLEPKKMKFGVSEGMVLAGEDSQGLYILEASHDLSPGSKIS
jgi:methionyl-tRNA synthetase